jgi:hypothetical protein
VGEKFVVLILIFADLFAFGKLVRVKLDEPKAKDYNLLDSARECVFTGMHSHLCYRLLVWLVVDITIL